MSLLNPSRHAADWSGQSTGNKATYQNQTWTFRRVPVLSKTPLYIGEQRPCPACVGLRCASHPTRAQGALLFLPAGRPTSAGTYLTSCPAPGPPQPDIL